MPRISSLPQGEGSIQLALLSMSLRIRIFPSSPLGCLPTFSSLEMHNSKEVDATKVVSVSGRGVQPL